MQQQVSELPHHCAQLPFHALDFGLLSLLFRVINEKGMEACIAAYDSSLDRPHCCGKCAAHTCRPLAQTLLHQGCERGLQGADSLPHVQLLSEYFIMQLLKCVSWIVRGAHTVQHTAHVADV